MICLSVCSIHLVLNILYSFFLCVYTEEEGGLDLVDFLESLNGEVGSAPSPLPHHISKRDISLPTKTAGPLFTSQADILGLDIDDEEVEDVGERSGSVPPDETLRPASVQEQMRERVSWICCSFACACTAS